MSTSPSIDVDAARAQTPGCATVAHFNNAGAALPSIGTLRAQIDHLELEARIGGYEAQDAAAEAIAAVRPTVARLVGGEPGEVALTASATHAFQLFLAAWAQSLPLGPGDRILTTTTEYGANYVAYLQLARRTGAEIEIVPDDSSGALDVGALDAMIDERVRLVSVNHVPTNGGLVNPAPAIGAVARAHGVPFLLDACQSAGQLPLDVAELGCDALTATGRKFLRGPRGTGFLWVRDALLRRLEPVLVDHDGATWTGPTSYELQPDARRFESWERNHAALLGLGHAVGEALAWGIDAIEARIGALADLLRIRLTDDLGATVHDLGSRRCGIVTFTLPGLEASTVKTDLRAHGINISTVPPASALLDSLTRDLPPLLRASPHVYNTEEEIDRLVTALR